MAVPIAMLARAAATGAGGSFPLDDAWIHLTYARTLAAGGGFRYFPGDLTTTGSTAPLFTLLEAIGFLVTHNEIVIGVTLGLAAHLVFLLALARWAGRRLGHAGWAAFVVALVAADGRFGILAASGMETSLFLAGVAVAFAAWTADDALVACIALGDAIWVRPEALVLAGVFAIDAALARRMPRRLPGGLAALAGLIATYLAFNRLTGSGWLPGTLAAKAAYYGDRTVQRFLVDDVAATFGGGWMLLIPFAAYGVWRTLRRSRDPQAPRAEIGWALALPLAYAIALRYSHRFNRYLVPALPAFAIAGAVGLRATLAAAGRVRIPARIAATAAVGLLLAAQALFFSSTLGDYATYSRYHSARHVRTGQWLEAHTPPDAVIATHDVGAIAFYSNRRIVDMAGLVTPEVIPHIRKPDYVPFLDSLFDHRGVSYLAVLEEWQPVDNEKPLFEADPQPQVMHVFAWEPGVTHLMDPGVRGLVAQAGGALRSGDTRGARDAVARALEADSGAASVWTLAGRVDQSAGQADQALPEFHRALALYPQSRDARLGLGLTLAMLARRKEALAQLDTLRIEDPDDPAIGALEDRIGGIDH